MQMTNNTVKYEVFVKRYLSAILDISAEVRLLEHILHLAYLCMLCACPKSPLSSAYHTCYMHPCIFTPFLSDFSFKYLFISAHIS